MEKLVRISILIATAAVPILAARSPSARRGLKRALVGMLCVVVLYWMAVMAVLPKV